MAKKHKLSKDEIEQRIMDAIDEAEAKVDKETSEAVAEQPKINEVVIPTAPKPKSILSDDMTPYGLA